MASKGSTDPERQLSILRKLKALVVVLIFSNLALGVFGFYYLRTVDHKYSDLINRAVPTLNDMQTLTASIMEAMRNINPSLHSNPPQAESTERARAALARARDLRTQILQREWLNDARERKILEQTGDAFDEKAKAVIDLLAAGKLDEATKLREQTVRPAFERYVAATTSAADAYQTQSLKTSSGLTERTLSVSKMMLGFASWPIVILSVVFLVTAALAAIVLFLFDRNLA
jgi:hypothetical protein